MSEGTERQRRVLNVGGHSGGIPLPGAYGTFEHVLLGLNPDVGADLVLDVRELTSLEPQQFDAVYCSHNLEHVRQHEVPGVLAGFRHVLKPGGLAHIIVPDLQELMLVCVQQGIDLDGLLYESPMGPITPLDVLYGHGGIIAQSGQDGYAPRTGFSRRTLANVVEASGFSPMFCQQGNLELNLITFNGNPDPELAALFDLPLDGTDPAAAS
ncbi:MAG: class I SAM-dependent methyltransferase [Vulcanococcus sp.]|jgi:SAM-dependent methyltransferase|uniref:class I SAM-dependent methyltransferase n=1 Tax=Vulcanococcus sp. TaxID=2856995 RepID=UPI0025D43C4A|nr:class I SAM-dependent methyltransferase [Vulcanococcus sp.]MBW0173033.1 class I SAM-dependent methyltransferase [Vulcanococcus sp.]MBW0179929.1 class I SAM-dependent methyltransferase [Vulcanococcus sp.]